MGMECDACGGEDYTEDRPRVLVRQQRLSDKTDMCCVLAGHSDCMGTKSAADLPSIGRTGGTATAEQWEDWIEGAQAARWGYCFLT